MGQAAAAVGCLITSVKMCNEIYKTVNQPIEDEENAFSQNGSSEEPGEVHVLIFALDYKRTQNPLSCSIDGRNMEQLVACCEIPRENVRAMYDDECTKEAAEEAIRDVAGRCGEGDTFVLYYSGHGTNLKDVSGDEDDGQDEAFCFVTPDGQVSRESCMTDDDFSNLLIECCEEQVKIVILTDCCHSGTICDFGTERGSWQGRHALSITGCLDSQTSGDIGRGGIFTHSMMLAIAQLQQEGDTDYNTAKLYNRALAKDEEVFHSEQELTLQCAPGFLPNRMLWPLIPRQQYNAPYERRSTS